MRIVWRTLDREAEIAVSERQMPHWDQTGALTIVTFRLADSMPKSVVQRWTMEQEGWLAQNHVPFDSIDEVLQSDRLPKDLRNQFRKFRLQRWHQGLDDCHGRCVLRDPELAQIVGDALRHFDGERYDLERFIVMPNHVHLLVQMRSGFALRKQCESWLRFTGRKINQQLALKGECWQSEPFDHVVRSEEQFHYLQRYIANNPAKARLREGKYLLWVRPEL